LVWVDIYGKIYTLSLCFLWVLSLRGMKVEWLGLRDMSGWLEGRRFNIFFFDISKNNDTTNLWLRATNNNKSNKNKLLWLRERKTTIYLKRTHHHDNKKGLTVAPIISLARHSLSSPSWFRTNSSSKVFAKMKNKFKKDELSMNHHNWTLPTKFTNRSTTLNIIQKKFQ